MKTERFEQVDRIFQAAIEREPAERQAYIDEACGGDAELRSRVQALLSADERAGNFIETPAYEVVAQMTEERSRTMMGQQIGPYRVASPLGAGGMGEVYLAKDLRLGRKVALKLLASHSIGDSQLRGRFLREARLASTLDHPNICTIYEVGEDSGHSYIAMQYVEGKTLKELVDRHPLGLKSLLSISLQVANALEAAHSQGIIHRDIKPSNIMLTARGQAKVLDFGLAKLMDEREAIAIGDEYRELTRTGAVMGTPAYMSPEQARGERADQRSDIFSFGVVLYTMATGRVPFRGKSPAETMNAVINNGHTPVRELNQEAGSGLSAVIDRALAKEPADRYQSITAMIAELRQVAQRAQVITSSEPDDMMIPYVPVRERARFGRLRQLMKSPALGASLLLLLALAAVLIWWQPWRRPPSRPQQHLISAFPGHHRAASFSPDGSMIAFISDAGGVPQVWVKNLAQGDPLQITFGEIPANRPRWSPNSDQIVFVRGTSTSSHEIWSVPPLGGTPRKVIEGGRNPNWSWDGSQLVYEKGDDVWTARADGSEQRRMEGLPPIAFNLGDRMPAYSRDGSLIAFFQNSKGPLGDIWVIPSAGGQPRQLTSDITISSAPVWLAGDSYIVYSSQRAGSTTLWKVPTSGGKPEPVLISPGEDTDPEVSRDGTKLIYTNTRNSYVITQMNPATKQTRELREARSLHCDPSLSPQGDKIAFFALSDDGSHIFTLGVDGRNLTQVTREQGEQNSFPCWSPDGLFLYFSQHRPTPSLQRISLEGGPSSEVAPGWSWDVSNGVQVDPTGKLLVCSKMENGETVATIIREIESGKETVFAIPLRYPRWSADGKWILGTSLRASKFRGWVGEISICSVETEICRQLTKDSKCPRWSADGSRVLFLRSGKAQYEEELWSISVTGEDEKQIAKLQMHEISSYYDVSSKGEIVYVRFNPGGHELWLLDFHNP